MILDRRHIVRFLLSQSIPLHLYPISRYPYRVITLKVIINRLLCLHAFKVNSCYNVYFFTFSSYLSSYFISLIINRVRKVQGTISLGYEKSWVRLVLGTNRPGYEMSWVRIVSIKTFRTWVRKVLGTNSLETL